MSLIFILSNLSFAFNPDEYAQEKIKQLKIEAEKGNVNSQFKLASEYMLQGFKEKQNINFKPEDNDNYKKALEWFELAAQNGHPKAPYQLANLYFAGYGTPINSKKTLDWLAVAMKNNDDQAFAAVGNLYKSGVFVKKDIKEALKFYKISADIKEDPDVYYMIGLIYYENDSPERNLSEALKWFEASSDIDIVKHSYADLMIAKIYSDGYTLDNKEIAPNYHKAFRLYEEIAKEDLLYMEASMEIGNMYYNGLGVKYDPNKAKEWFGKACNGGNQKGCDLYKELSIQSLSTDIPTSTN